jgi:DNA-binding GntR family transcriptional regulator
VRGPSGEPDYSAGLKSLRPVSLREQAHQAIRTSIVTGDMQVGRVYSVPVLADQLGVSPTPVREAMLDLVKERLLEPVRNKGFRVPALSDAGLEDIFEIRLLLEAATMRRIARPMPGRQRDKFARLVAEMERRAQAADLTGFLEADRRFHLGLLALIGNQRLVEIVGSLRDQARLYGLADLARAGSLTASATEHIGILDAIAQGEGARAESLMRRHLEHTRGVWAGRSEPSADDRGRPAGGVRR